MAKKVLCDKVDIDCPKNCIHSEWHESVEVPNAKDICTEDGHCAFKDIDVICIDVH